MPVEQEQLQQKAMLLLRRERELNAHRVKAARVTSWLQLAQSLPGIVDRTLPLEEIYTRLRRALLIGLKLQRVAFFEMSEAGGTDDGIELAPLAGAAVRGEASPRHRVTGEAAAPLLSARAGFCNSPDTPALRRLAETVGLQRFMWSRVCPIELPRVLLVAGFDAAKAAFNVPFDEHDAAHLGNMAQHLEMLVGNAFLVNALLHEKLQLKALNDSLEQRVLERTEALARSNGELTKTLTALEDKDQRLSRDLEQARSFQQRILPALPETAGISFGALYRPVDMVGGDIYDVVEVSPGRYRVFLADVTGHGVQASLRTIVLRSEYDRLKADFETPDRLMDALNRRLVRQFSESEMMSTACCFDIDISSASAPVLRYTNAAHPPLLHAGARGVSEIYCDGPFLGVPSGDVPGEEVWQLVERRLAPGDLLLGYSDGLCEQLGRTRAGTFDCAMAIKDIGHGVDPAAAYVDRIGSAFDAFRDGQPVADDVTIVAAVVGRSR